MAKVQIRIGKDGIPICVTLSHILNGCFTEYSIVHTSHLFINREKAIFDERLFVLLEFTKRILTIKIQRKFFRETTNKPSPPHF